MQQKAEVPQSSTPSKLSAKNFVSASDKVKTSVWDIILKVCNGKDILERKETLQNNCTNITKDSDAESTNVNHHPEARPSLHATELKNL